MNNINLKKGEIALISVLLIGGALITSAAIAGLVTIYQIRQANDVAASTKAIFAADAGIEWQSYCYKTSNANVGCPQNENEFKEVPFTFSNGATSSVAYKVINEEIIMRSIGGYGDAVRALETVFTQSF